jgi:aconitate hydratase
VSETVRPRDLVQVKAIAEDGTVKSFEAVVRFDSEVEIDYYRHGGILQMVLRNKMKQ